MMANEDLKKRLVELQMREESLIERETIGQEMRQLESKAWARRHPRLARLRKFFGGMTISGGGNNGQNY